MPPRKTAAKKKRIFRRYRRRPIQINNYLKKPSVSSLARIPWFNPQPTQAMVKLRYCDVSTVTSSAGATSTNQYNIGSLYDPDHTFVGHQPYTYDQISGLFNSYCVRAVRIKLKCTACTTPMRVNVVPKFNSSSITTNLSLAEEYKYSSNFMVGIEGVEKSFYYDLAKISGTTWDAFKKDSSAVMSASPAATSYWNLMVRSADLTSSGTLAYDLEIEFIALVSQDLVQAQS